MTRSFLILHGWANRRPPEHWEHRLADELTARGFEVRYPQLPDPDEPSLDVWIDEVATALEGWDPATTTVIAHSLGATTWLQSVARGRVPRPARLLLVAPPDRAVLEPTVIAEFVHGGWTDPGSDDVTLIAGEGDEYSPNGPGADYAEPLGLEFVTIPGAGHLTPASGYGPWPAVVEWCTTGTTEWRANTAEPAA